MAFDDISIAEIAAGKPGTTTLWNKVRTNSDDADSRLTTVEAATASFLPIVWTEDGRIKTKTGVETHRFNFNTDINQVRLIIGDTQEGTSGTCEIDVLRATTIGGAYTSIFSTRPSLAFGASPGVSTNGILTATPFPVLGGQFIRLDIISVQGSQRQFNVSIEFSPT